MARTTLAALVILLGSAALSAQQKSTRPVVRTLPAALFRVYEENEAKADQQFTGKYVEVIGNAEKVEKTKDGSYVLVVPVVAGSRYDPPPSGLRAHFTGAEAAKLADMKFPGYVLFVGRCEGRKKARGYWKDFYLELRDCRQARQLTEQEFNREKPPR
jgi:hypothetical protein